MMAFVVISVMSKDIIIETKNKGNKVPPHRCELPQATYDGKDVKIVSAFVINNALIRILDEDGNAISTVLASLTPKFTSITIPASIDEKAFTLEIVYQDYILTGKVDDDI